MFGQFLYLKRKSAVSQPHRARSIDDFITVNNYDRIELDQLLDVVVDDLLSLRVQHICPDDATASSAPDFGVESCRIERYVVRQPDLSDANG